VLGRLEAKALQRDAAADGDDDEHAAEELLLCTAADADNRAARRARPGVSAPDTVSIGVTSAEKGDAASAAPAA